jgi:hypothetical protein
MGKTDDTWRWVETITKTIETECENQVITYLVEEQKQRAEASASVVKGVCSYQKEVMEDMKNSLSGEL